MAKISKYYILTPPHPQGYEMSVKCEQSIHEKNTVQVWLLYHHSNFKYCTLLVSGTELQTDKQTDDPIARCPLRTFQAGGIIKIILSNYNSPTRLEFGVSLSLPRERGVNMNGPMATASDFLFIFTGSR